MKKLIQGMSGVMLGMMLISLMFQAYSCNDLATCRTKKEFAILKAQHPALDFNAYKKDKDLQKRLALPQDVQKKLVDECQCELGGKPIFGGTRS